MKYAVGILVSFLGLFFAAIALYYVYWQQHAMTDFVETPAAIVSSHVEVHRGRKSSSYVPKITYQYSAGGQLYSTPQTSPFDATSYCSTSYAVGNPHPPPGQRLTHPGVDLIPNTAPSVNPHTPAE